MAMLDLTIEEVYEASHFYYLYQCLAVSAFSDLSHGFIVIVYHFYVCFFFFVFVIVRLMTGWCMLLCLQQEFHALFLLLLCCSLVLFLQVSSKSFLSGSMRNTLFLLNFSLTSLMQISC